MGLASDNMSAESLDTDPYAFALRRASNLLTSLPVDHRARLAKHFLQGLQLPENALSDLVSALPSNTRDPSLLPAELFLMILSHLSYRDLARCRQVNRNWDQCLSSAAVWKGLYLQKFSRISDDSSDESGDSTNATTLEHKIEQDRTLTSKGGDPWFNLYATRHTLENNWWRGRCSMHSVSHGGCFDYAHLGTVYSVQADLAHDIVVSASHDHTAKLWSLSSRKLLRVFYGHSGSVLCLHLDLNRGIVLSGSADNTIIAWRALDGLVLKRLTGHGAAVTGLAANGEILASCSRDGFIRLWSLATLAPIGVLGAHNGCVNTICIRNSLLVSGSSDRTVVVWDLKSQHPIHVFQDLDASVSSVAFISDDTIVAGTRGGAICWFNIRTGQRLGKIRGAHSRTVRSLCYNDTHQLLISASHDGLIKVWNANLHTIDSSNSNRLSVSSDSKHIDKRTVSPANTRYFELLYSLSEHNAGKSQFHVSTDSRYLLSCGEDLCFTVYDFGLGASKLEYAHHF